METLDAPRLRSGTEILGEFQGSGFKTPYYLVRRPDGQVVQMSRLVYLLARNIDGRRSVEEIAHRLSGELDKTVTAENVEYLIENKLAPTGVTHTGEELAKAPSGLLMLRWRRVLVSAPKVALMAKLFWPLFLWPVVVAALVGFVALDVWMFAFHGVSGALRESLLHPMFVLVVLGSVVVSGLFHECGHASASYYGGGKPGAIGVGFYLAWPAFYTDVTDSYRLPRRARLRTDLGGVYFNVLLILVLGGLYSLTHFEPLLLMILFEQMEIVEQFMPFLRLDGYYVVSDLTGVPDLFSRIRPVVASLVPGRADPRVTELKRAARAVITVWVFITIPVLFLQLGFLVWKSPEFAQLYWTSFRSELTVLSSQPDPGRMAVGVTQILVLAITAAGFVLLYLALAKRGLALLRRLLAWTYCHSLGRLTHRRPRVAPEGTELERSEQAPAADARTSGRAQAITPSPPSPLPVGIDNGWGPRPPQSTVAPLLVPTSSRLRAAEQERHSTVADAGWAARLGLAPSGNEVERQPSAQRAGGANRREPAPSGSRPRGRRRWGRRNTSSSPTE